MISDNCVRVNSLAQWLEHLSCKRVAQVLFPAGALGIFQLCFMLVTTLVKSALLKINILISQPKHMLWVLKRTISMEWFY